MHMEIKGRHDEEMQHPWLLISQKEKQFFYSVSTNRFHTTNIPELRNKYVAASAFEWLVLVDIETNYCCLWHPVSLDKIELPKLNFSWMFTNCLLSKPPTEPNCHILFTARDTMSQYFCQIGDDQLVTQTSTDDKELCLSAVVSFHGKIYGILITSDLWYKFINVDFVGGTLRLNQILMDGGQPWLMPHPTRSWATTTEDYLILSCGELLLVHKMYSSYQILDCMDFRVFLMDIDRKKYKELENIGKRTIFVSDAGDAFCCSSFGLKPNSIYYTLPLSRELFVYDLNDRGTTISQPCSIAKKNMPANSWVPPQVFRVSSGLCTDG